jgi:ABC-type polysaccharide transport system, permease component
MGIKKSAALSGSPIVIQTSGAGRLIGNIRRDKYLLILLLPVVAYFVIFHYLPMYGVIIAFKDFSPMKGILGSPWVGFKWFMQFYEGEYFFRVLKNTVLLSVYSLLWGFPIPIIFALLLNEYRDGAFKKLTQTISYLPHFISTVIIVGMIVNFLSPNDGIVNSLIKAFGYEPVNFLVQKEWFRTIYISTNIWQQFGWNSIIYIATISSLDPGTYEAARIDGANRWKQAIHVTIPGLMPTIVILFILNIGSLMAVNFEKILLMYNEVTYPVADVISTYVYRIGIQGSEFGYGAAVGLFNSIINLVLLFSANKIVKKLTAISLW